MPIFKDLTGQKFERWLVIERKNNSDCNLTQWLCECQCENKTRRVVLAHSLTSGKSKSCGCLKKEKVSERNKMTVKSNVYNLVGEYGIGYTSNTNLPFYFDLEDYDKIKKHCWLENPYGYITSANDHKTIYIHRIIMNPKRGMVVDHINHNKYDNRKNNLRICLQNKNAKNCLKPKNNTTGTVGVLWDKRSQKWKAIIGVDNKQIHIGYFNIKEEAIKARLEAERKYYGEYMPNEHKTFNCKGE